MRPIGTKLNKDQKTANSRFTLPEVMIAIAIIGVLASIAVASYIKYKEKARIELAITEMKIIEEKISRLVTDNGELPEDLSQIGLDNIIDHWGRPYSYLKIFGHDEAKADKGKKDDNSKKGKPRKDHSLHSINTDFDLYSVGKDGKSAVPLTAKISQDDIVRAKNGNCFGLVSERPFMDGN